MNEEIIIAQLEKNRSVFQALFDSVFDEQIKWKPFEDKWSILEVACHLYDEEREDFRARMLHTLEQKPGEFNKIDPQAWVKERNYIGQDFRDVVSGFLSERDESVSILKALHEPDWNLTYIHPRVGPLKAKLFLANWLAHDYLHIRQITRLKYEYLGSNYSEPLDYAGNW